VVVLVIVIAGFSAHDRSGESDPSSSAQGGTGGPTPTTSVDGPTGDAFPTTSPVDLSQIRVDDSVPADPYLRAAFGPAWADADRNGCDTRNDVLARDLTDVTYKPGTHDCVVTSGTLADPYTGTTVTFTKGADTSPLVQIDHIVPLAYAWRHGASAWTDARRLAFANDQNNLQATSGSANQAKSSKGPAAWMPADRADWCQYATQFATTLITWDLTTTADDKAALATGLATCQ